MRNLLTLLFFFPVPPFLLWRYLFEPNVSKSFLMHVVVIVYQDTFLVGRGREMVAVREGVRLCVRGEVGGAIISTRDELPHDKRSPLN